MRLAAAVVAALFAVVALSGLPGGSATHEDEGCAKSLETVKVGTGNVGIDLAVLNGVNHVDIPFPPCSAGGFMLDHTSDGILHESHCSDKFLRVYAPVGTTGYEAKIHWKYASEGNCI